MPKKTDKTVEPIDASGDGSEKIIVGATPKPNGGNALQRALSKEGAITEKQLVLDIGIEVERDINGVEMGVLENGMAFLSQRGLQRIVGVTRKKLFDITNDWEESYASGLWSKGRISFIAERLSNNGYMEPKLHVEVMKDGVVHYAYPDIVCMAILEYYAFEANSPIPEALENYRNFAQYGLQKFIYDAIGYQPGDSWKYFNDRVSLLKDASPDGYFIIFKETAGMVVDLIHANMTVSDKTLPDISVGLSWANYWRNEQLSEKHGERTRYDHSYPDYYPQAASNPQPAWAYPEDAIPEFRRWFRSQYLTTKFPAYILKKANVLKGGKEEAARIAAMYTPKQIGD